MATKCGDESRHALVGDAKGEESLGEDVSLTSEILSIFEIASSFEEETAETTVPGDVSDAIGRKGRIQLVPHKCALSEMETLEQPRHLNDMVCTPRFERHRVVQLSPDQCKSEDLDELDATQDVTPTSAWQLQIELIKDDVHRNLKAQASDISNLRAKVATLDGVVCPGCTLDEELVSRSLEQKITETWKEQFQECSAGSPAFGQKSDFLKLSSVPELACACQRMMQEHSMEIAKVGISVARLQDDISVINDYISMEMHGWVHNKLAQVELHEESPSRPTALADKLKRQSPESCGVQFPTFKDSMLNQQLDHFVGIDEKTKEASMEESMWIKQQLANLREDIQQKSEDIARLEGHLASQFRSATEECTQEWQRQAQTLNSQLRSAMEECTQKWQHQAQTLKSEVFGKVEVEETTMIALDIGGLREQSTELTMRMEQLSVNLQEDIQQKSNDIARLEEHLSSQLRSAMEECTQEQQHQALTLKSEVFDKLEVGETKSIGFPSLHDREIGGLHVLIDGLRESQEVMKNSSARDIDTVWHALRKAEMSQQIDHVSLESEMQTELEAFRADMDRQIRWASTQQAADISEKRQRFETPQRLAKASSCQNITEMQTELDAFRAGLEHQMQRASTQQAEEISELRRRFETKTELDDFRAAIEHQMQRASTQQAEEISELRRRFEAPLETLKQEAIELSMQRVAETEEAQRLAEANSSQNISAQVVNKLITALEGCKVEFEDARRRRFAWDAADNADWKELIADVRNVLSAKYIESLKACRIAEDTISSSKKGKPHNVSAVIPEQMNVQYNSGAYPTPPTNARDRQKNPGRAYRSPPVKEHSAKWQDIQKTKRDAEFFN